MIDTTLLIREPAEVYHKNRRKYLTSSDLRLFFKNPILYRAKHTTEEDQPDTLALVFGRAAHARILEGEDQFQLQFAWGGPKNPKTDKEYGYGTNAWNEWAKELPLPALPTADVMTIESMAQSVESHAYAQELLQNGVAERVLRAELHGVACQARYDWINPMRGIVDLKTTDDLDRFEGSCWRYGYRHQMAFYQEVMFNAGACERNVELPIHIIAVEKKEPFRVGVWRVDRDALDEAAVENEETIKRLNWAITTGDWPTGYEEVRTLSARG